MTATWLRYWTPCNDHREPSLSLLDDAIAGWREDQRRNGCAPHDYAMDARRRWQALGVLRQIIRACADCYALTASAASAGVMNEAARLANPVSPSALAKRFQHLQGPQFTGAEMDAWRRRMDARNAAARRCGYGSIWEAGASEAVANLTASIGERQAAA